MKSIDFFDKVLCVFYLALGLAENRQNTDLQRIIAQMQRSMAQMQRSMEEIKLENRRFVNIGPEMDQEIET